MEVIDEHVTNMNVVTGLNDEENEINIDIYVLMVQLKMQR